MKSKATAVWQGDLKDGRGQLNTTSNALNDVPYDFKTRFEGADGTNPEELIAAAHAGCFSMALSNILGEENLTAESIQTKATVSLEKTDDGFAITKVHLDVTAKVPEASQEVFSTCAAKAKVGCPVSKLMNAEITMDANLS